jgi:hypothetical protein
MPRGRHGSSIKRPKVYDALRRQGFSKSKAAAISNAGRTHAQRVAMARKAANTRKHHTGHRVA